MNEVVIENEVADEEEREEAALHLNQLNENLVTNTFFSDKRLQCWNLQS